MAAESYPTYLSGQRITASLLQSAQPLVCRKTADTARSATATAVADPHIQFTLAANATYVMDGWLKVSGDSTSNLLLDWTAPTGCLGEWVGHGAGVAVISTSGAPGTLVASTASTRGYMVRTESTDITASRSFGLITTADLLTIALWGTIRTASTGGTYSMDWSQNTSGASATTLYTDSWVRLVRTA